MEEWLKQLGTWFTNSTIGAAMADQPAVMTASGWKRNPDGSYDQKDVDKPGVEELRNNLIGISALSNSVYSPYILKGLWNGMKIAGQAMTPSTWIGGISEAAGYQAPNWMLNTSDLGASVYFANKAGNELDKEGLNWYTGTNAIMSLAPFTRDTEAIQGISNGLKSLSNQVRKVVNKGKQARRNYILSKELNKAIQETMFHNIDIEHVSPNGITEGSALDTGKEYIHFSNLGSPTSHNIMLNMDYPYLRTGYFTYTDNTAPIWTSDHGSFKKGANPRFDRQVKHGVNNFKYQNQFESNDISYVTTTPEFGFGLSKNINMPYTNSNVWLVTQNGFVSPEGFVASKYPGFRFQSLADNVSNFREDDLGFVFEIPNYGQGHISVNKDGTFNGSIINQKRVLHSFQNKSSEDLSKAFIDIKNDVLKSPLQKQAYLRSNLHEPSKAELDEDLSKIMKEYIQDNIEQIKSSPENYDRALEAGITDTQFDDYLESLGKINNEAVPFIFNSPNPGWYGHTLVSPEGKSLYGFNISAAPDIHPEYTDDFLRSVLSREFGKISNKIQNPITEYNSKLLKDVSKYLKSKKITDPEEIMTRLKSGVEEAIQTGMSVEDIFDNSVLFKVTEIPQILERDYAIDVMNKMIAEYKTDNNKDKA